MINKINNQLLTRKPVSRIDRIRFFMTHRKARKQFLTECKIITKHIGSVFPDLAQTRAIIQAAVPTNASFGNVQPYELIILSTVCAHLKPKVIFEFGTYDGLTTSHLAMNSPASTHVLTIDLHPDDPIRQITTDDTFYTQGVEIGAHYRNINEANKVEQIFSNTTKYDHDGLEGKVDFIFVDAGHEYALVKSDSQKALNMISPGGIIFWHDYFYTQVGVYSFLNELALSKPLFNIANTSLVCYIRPEN